ncbi:MAG: mechanosensitive ion channel [Chloroflexi bacterium]|jgi:small-conductance mechanosensitive channel|nr:mechanosensitive ion channel [Chloroflexota bacterium]
MMDNGSVNQTETLVDNLRSQVDVLLAVISRPVVQQQILAFLFILLVAWILPEALRRWRQQQMALREVAETESKSRRQRWFSALYHLLTPILALVFLNITLWLFARQGYPRGLLQDLTRLIWFWLIYRALLSLLYARYGDAIRPYQNRLVTPLFLFFVILQIFATLPGSVTLVETIINLGSISFSLGNLVNAVIVLYLFVVAAWILKQLMVRSLPTYLQAEPGVIESVATLTRYALLVLGILISLGMLGLDFTSLAIIAGGLSVGIGIGLQDIVSNFVSGLVLLFEQSLRPGDVVELDGRISQVEKISLRATTVRTRTNEEVIIPNANFTTHQVKNLTKTDRLVQVIVPLGVSYKSEPELVRRLAVETSLQHPLVLDDPPPLLLFLGYGESSLDFNLLVSVIQPEMTLLIRSDLYYLLWKVFAEHDIEIPFPQRDLNLGDGWEKLASDLPAT